MRDFLVGQGVPGTRIETLSYGKERPLDPSSNDDGWARNRNARDQYRDHRWAGLCEDFCANWDQNSFDPDFPIHDLESFRDDVHEVFGRPAWSPDVIAVGRERLR